MGMSRARIAAHSSEHMPHRKCQNTPRLDTIDIAWKMSRETFLPPNLAIDLVACDEERRRVNSSPAHDLQLNSRACLNTPSMPAVAKQQYSCRHRNDKGSRAVGSLLRAEIVSWPKNVPLHGERTLGHVVLPRLSEWQSDGMTVLTSKPRLQHNVESKGGNGLKVRAPRAENRRSASVAERWPECESEWTFGASSVEDREGRTAAPRKPAWTAGPLSHLPLNP